MRPKQQFLFFPHENSLAILFSACSTKTLDFMGFAGRLISCLYIQSRVLLGYEATSKNPFLINSGVRNKTSFVLPLAK